MACTIHRRLSIYVNPPNLAADGTAEESQKHLGTLIVRIRDEHRGRDCVNREMYVEAAMEWGWRCTRRARSSLTCRYTWRSWWSEFEDSFGGWDWVIERCTWRPWEREWGDALGGRDCVTARCTWRPRSSNSVMDFEALFEGVWRCTWGPRLGISEMH
jgi:hypothetical protein